MLIHFSKLFVPLQNLTLASDGGRYHLTSHQFRFFCQLIFDSKNRAGFQVISQKVSYDGVLVFCILSHGELCIFKEKFVFRGSGRRSRIAFSRMNSGLHTEAHIFFQHRIDPLQILSVLGKKILVEKVPAEPRITHGPEVPLSETVCWSRFSPDIRIVEAAGSVHAKVIFRRLFSVGCQLLTELHQRLAHLRQVAEAGGPVVHLCVDIDRVIGEPGRNQLRIPDSLEVCRLGTRS